MTTISQQLTHANENLRDGWISAASTWTYASASTITVPSGAASIYQKGDRIRWKQGGAYKYGVLVAVADTLLTIAVNTDYTVATPTAITDNYYSHQANPLGYPGSFNYTPTYTGFSSNPSGVTAKYSIIGNRCFLYVFTNIAGTSNATGYTLTAPITNAGPLLSLGAAQALDSGSLVTLTPICQVSASSTTITCYAGQANNAWTNSGDKRVVWINGSYEI